MAPQTARPVLGGLVALLLLQQAVTQTIISTRTPAATNNNNITFSSVVLNQSGMASNSFQVSSAATINGVTKPLSGYDVIARSGFVDSNGNILGLLLVRAVLACPCLCARC